MRTIAGLVLIAALWLSPSVVFKVLADKPQDNKAEFTNKLLGEFKVTSYRSVKAQTDGSPYWSSIGIHTNPWMVAVSRDFLRDGRLQYNDEIYIEEVGFKTVGDVMNARYKNRLDVWVENHEQEHQFHMKFKNRKLKVWLIKRG